MALKTFPREDDTSLGPPQQELSAAYAGGRVNLLIERALGELVDQNIASWNRIAGWLRHIDQLRLGA